MQAPVTVLCTNACYPFATEALRRQCRVDEDPIHGRWEPLAAPSLTKAGTNRPDNAGGEKAELLRDINVCAFDERGVFLAVGTTKGEVRYASATLRFHRWLLMSRQLLCRSIYSIR
jgi:hypothetical protein